MQENPIRAPLWPELADISISNYCSKGCDYFYRDSNNDGSFMNKDEYEFVLDQLTSSQHGSVFQVALGGGELLEIPHCLDIVDATVQRGIVANLTTNADLVDCLNGKGKAIAMSVNNMSQFRLEKCGLFSFQI